MSDGAWRASSAAAASASSSRPRRSRVSSSRRPSAASRGARARAFSVAVERSLEIAELVADLPEQIPFDEAGRLGKLAGQLAERAARAGERPASRPRRSGGSRPRPAESGR